MFGEVKAALGDGDFVNRFFQPPALELVELSLDRGLVAAVVDVSEFEEDEAKDGGAIFGRLEVGIGAKVIGRRPEVVFELFELVACH